MISVRVHLHHRVIQRNLIEVNRYRQSSKSID